MASASVATDALNSVQLLIKVSDTILGAARILRTEEKDGELKLFYADVTAHCAIMNSHWKRISKVVHGINADLIYRTLNHLESAIAPDILDLILHEALPSGPNYKKLRAFNRHWERIQKQRDHNATLKYIRLCMNLGTNVEERDRFIQLLARCEQELQTRYPESQSDGGFEELSTNASVIPSSCAVQSAAQSIFEALVACSNCDCTPSHEAQLRLGTYRKPNVGGEVEMDENLDFDMFLSIKQSWHEARVLMVKELEESVVQFQKTATKINQLRIRRLCEQIAKFKTAANRLELKVTGGQLFKLRSERRSTLLIDRTRSPVTLEQFLRNGSRPLTERTKRILAVMLSYAVLYLHDTPWLQPTWSSSHVLFLPTTSSSIPLRPFIQTHLARHYKFDQDSCINPEDTDPDDLDPDDLLVHHCPLLITLAVMLMELYFAVPFDILAKQYGVHLTADAQSPISTLRYLDVNLVFEACRGEIPEGYKFHYVVEKCLDPATWEDEDENKLDREALISKIYQEVVKPLETELSQAYSDISSDDLDDFAQKIDIANWDQNIQMWNQQTKTEASEYYVQNLKQNYCQQIRSISPSYFPQPSAGDFYNQRSEACQHGHHLNVTPSSLNDALPETMNDDGYRASLFFDDETISGAHTNEARSNYHHWKSRYLKVYDKFIPKNPVPPSIKIAILDTGIDIQHPDIDARLENIKERYNWLSENGTTNLHLVTDRSGHGTFAASLILDYAPDAQLYVAKIADNEPSRASVIAKAINYAVSIWEVDIISMSFGFPTCNLDDYHELEDALANAHAKRVLLFAAASNSGGKLGRAYPARDQNVIAIHATDTYGNRSGFSPTALAHDINLATVGEAIESAWPVYLPDKSNPKSLKCKSGTSFATPIAASIAAFLLLYAKIHLPDKAEALKSRQRMQALLRRVAEKEAGQTARDGYYFIDLSLYADSLFGKSKEFIDGTIRDLLST